MGSTAVVAFSPHRTTVQLNKPATQKLLPLVLSPTSSSPNL
jgi:hypothetical protein